jgi:uncharacterized repeat protein (TIGR02543 family)
VTYPYLLTEPVVPTTYTVTYNGNGSTGGTVPVDSSSYLTGAPVTVLGNTGSLVKTGYTFAGWNTQADGLGTTYAAGDSFDMGTSSVTLYAKWTEATGSDGIIFVKASASPGGDGTSWANAFNDLQNALAEATSGKEIWVAAGTMLPAAPGWTASPLPAAMLMVNILTTLGEVYWFIILISVLRVTRCWKTSFSPGTSLRMAAALFILMLT